ncbi:class GN sortase [Bowmanella sp. Y26]|uniref:class GN sortase n=1 Tax=Bowmanella yangjiangensis TaxID=2811230 RepID=UPI001BDBD4DD|nr:class GN sortase [Bowmanella yangjiangensis]MBT1064011.1 class GN sortase [Bowmanella yangjiangensis]
MDPLSSGRALFCYALLALGLALMASGGYVQAKARLANHLIEDAWQQALAEPQSQVRPWFYADTYVVAQLDFPIHQQKLTVLAGASGRNLAFGPGHLLASGALNNSHEQSVLIAGHNDTHFSFLQHVQVGERFAMQTQDGRWQHFQIANIQVIDEKDIGFLARPGLYLSTCYPFNSLAADTPWRWLVEAQPVLALYVAQLSGPSRIF